MVVGPNHVLVGDTMFTVVRPLGEGEGDIVQKEAFRPMKIPASKLNAVNRTVDRQHIIPCPIEEGEGSDNPTALVRVFSRPQGHVARVYKWGGRGYIPVEFVDQLDLQISGEAEPGRLYIGSTKIFSHAAAGHNGTAPVPQPRFIPIMEVSETAGRVPTAVGTHLQVTKLSLFPQFQHLTSTFGRISYSNGPMIRQAAQQLGLNSEAFVILGNGDLADLDLSNLPFQPQLLTGTRGGFFH